MDKLHLFEAETSPERPRVGMRMVKTAVAVLICGLVGWLRGEQSFLSMIAAIICMQSTREKTILAAFNRELGTLIGAAFGVGMLYIAPYLNTERLEPLYCLAVAAAVIPVIWLTLLIKKPSVSAFACIVLVVVSIGHTGDAAPWAYALERTIETTVGISVSLLLNLLIPNKKAGDGER